MRFLHVSTGDARGAFSGAYRLHRNLIESGHESRMLVCQKQTTDPTVMAPRAITQNISRQSVRAMNQLLKLACGRERQVAHHIAFNFDSVPSRQLIEGLNGYQPDLVIVHYTSGFISPSGLLDVKLATRAPMALYLMDMEMLTGACHYAWDCTGYLARCAECPVPRPGVVKAAISRQWKRRKEALDRIQPVVVAGSGWLMRQAAMSTITGAFERRLILMGIDEKVYAPGDKHALRARFGLPPDAIVLYVGAQNLGDPRKGFRYLDAALRQLEEMLDVSERTKVVLFTVGKLDPQLQGSLPLAHVHSAYITDPRLFAATYAAADLFICPSVEDSGPMMINESIMSGTPVAAFEMGVAVDLVETGVTGYRVPLADSRALAAALASFVRLPPAERAAMSTACRTVGLEKSSSSGQVRAFVDLAAQMQGSPKHMIAG